MGGGSLALLLVSPGALADWDVTIGETSSGGGAVSGDITVAANFGATGLILQAGATGEVIFDTIGRFANGVPAA